MNKTGKKAINHSLLGNRKILTLLLCGAAAALLGGCTGKAKAPVDTTVHLGVMYSSDIVPLTIITEQGLDKKYGFQLDMQVFSSAKDRDAALQAGKLDGVFTDFIGLCMYQNAELDVKATGCTDGDYVLLAGKDTGITSLEDASGKSIAISENTLIEYSLDYILNNAGLDDTYLDKQVVPRIPDRLEMLRNGKIDLVLLPEPFSTLAIKDGAVVLGSANTDGLYPAVSAFTKKAIDEKSDTLQKMYQAYDEAVDYLNNTPLKEYEAVIIKGAGYPEELTGAIKLPVYRKNELPKATDLQAAVEWAAKKGLCSPELKPDQLIGELK
ncbi:ABC transporter substrate-binding protein [Lacrimispora indolis]|uniref:ABC transporter substrate-binding protein n=1 Tax=Lacrimispora indolis TaxID=69825 RepID=UPI0018DE8909|nr:MetQ/NlpA family ABC transporter substrate-binding protein [[Clostridium] methoxybenzovorans]